ncbi:MAG: hypothetical protein ACRC2Y_04435 [Aeromonas veronii]
MRVELCKGIPHQIACKAMELITMAEAGEIRPKALWCNRDNVRVLEIGYRYRALELSGKWVVVTHEKYNKLLHKRK